MKKLFLLLILIIPSLCFAQTKHNDWWTIIKGNYFYAYTNNESDAALGVICSDGCVYYANLLVECKEGESYNALLSTENGAIPIRITCMFVDDKYLFSLQPNDDITSAFNGAKTVGIAVPLDDGKFSVARFSLTGSENAFKELYKASQKRKEQEATFKNETL